MTAPSDRQVAPNTDLPATTTAGGMSPPGDMPRVLLALPDRPELADLVRSLLALRMLPFVAVTVRHATSLLSAIRLDLLLLDHALLGPGGDLSAWRALAERVTVLAPAGKHDLPEGVDVVQKAVSNLELSMFVREALRLSVRLLRWGNLDIDMRRREARWMSHRLDISPIQLRLLIALMEADGAVVSKEELARRLFGNCSSRDERVETHVRRIRRQLAASGGESDVLQTIRGEGYRLMATAPR